MVSMPSVAVVGGSLGGLTTALLLRDAGCRVTVHEHLDDSISITLGPQLVGRYRTQAMEMTPSRKATKRVASLNGLEKSDQKAA